MFWVLERFITLANRILGLGFGTQSLESEFENSRKFLIEQPKLILDIGGNKGEYTQTVIQKFPNAEVHIFEPSNLNYKLLLERFKKYPNIHISNNAISDQQESQILYADVEGSGLASLTQRRLGHFGLEMQVEERVETTTIDKYWTEVLNERDIDIIKIDIEGHELSALRGAHKALEHVKVVQFEFGGCNIDTRSFFQDFWYFFLEKGFSLYRNSPIGSIPIPRYTESLEYFQTTNYIAVKK